MRKLEASARVNVSYIDESEFPCGAYYPLIEIVTIALARQRFGMDAVKKELARLGIEFEDLNIVSPPFVAGATVIFKLLPHAKEYEKDELMKKDAERKRALIAV